MSKSVFNERVDKIIQETKDDYARREKELKRVLKEAEKAEDVFVVGKINLHLSMCYFELGNRVDILPHACKAVGIFENTDEYTMLARSYNLLGIAYGAQENYQQALASYNKALEIIRGRKKPGIRKEIILNNIAESYYQMGEYQKSVHIMKGCYNSCKKKMPDNHSSISIYGLNLSDLYESMEDFKKSIDILDEIRADIDALGQDTLVYGYYARRACVLYKLGDVDAGSEYADLALNFIKTSSDSYEFHRDFEKIASLEVSFGDCERAQRFADVLTKYADSNGHTIDLIISKRVQATICDSRGEKERALILYKELNDLYEKRVSEQNAMQYESQKNSEAASREIAKLIKKIRISEEKAERDPLTGLMNRSALVSVTNEFIQNAKEKGRKLGGIFLDIDYFKEFNDTYGHAAGDEAIKYIAKVCLGEETSKIKFFRYGGDEYFGIVLGHKDEDIEKIALRISETVRSSGYEHIKNPNGQRLTVSIGVVNINMKESNHTILDIIKYADKALYHAKDYGKDVVFAFRAGSNSEHEYKQVVAC